MTTLPLKFIPDPVLKVRAKEITTFDDRIRQLSRDMVETMYVSKGIGLAANQIGVLERIIVVDVTEDCSSPLILINPEIVLHEGTIRSEEGCLSIPDYRDTISRHALVKVRAQNVDGETLEVEGEDLFGRCLQHEIDHLDGVLFVDRLSRLKKQLFKRWLIKKTYHEPETTVQEEESN